VLPGGDQHIFQAPEHNLLDYWTFVLGGMFRAFSNASFFQLRRQIEDVITLQARLHGFEAALDFFRDKSFYSPTVNDAQM
jgi:IAA-amino acid hydrolase